MLNWLGYTFFNLPAHRLYRELYKSNPALVSYPGTIRFRRMVLSELSPPQPWRNCVLCIAAEGLSLYPRAPKPAPGLIISPEQLVWFGRPTKYMPGTNYLFVHAQIDDSWHILELRTHKYLMQDLVRAMKTIATPDQITAYRRRPPHVQYGPVKVRRATQDIHGVWTLHETLPFYVMPRFAVLLDTTYKVQRLIPLEQVQRIEALRRMDVPGADGVVRFRVGDETLAFTTVNFEELAKNLADAARRTLEDPIIRKKKKHDDWDEDDSEY